MTGAITLQPMLRAAALLLVLAACAAPAPSATPPEPASGSVEPDPSGTSGRARLRRPPRPHGRCSRTLRSRASRWPSPPTRDGSGWPAASRRSARRSPTSRSSTRPRASGRPARRCRRESTTGPSYPMAVASCSSVAIIGRSPSRPIELRPGARRERRRVARGTGAARCPRRRRRHLRWVARRCSPAVSARAERPPPMCSLWSATRGSGSEPWPRPVSTSLPSSDGEGRVWLLGGRVNGGRQQPRRRRARHRRRDRAARPAADRAQRRGRLLRRRASAPASPEAKHPTGPSPRSSASTRRGP